VQGIAATYPGATTNVSITVDPRVLDELQREVKSYPIVRIMEATKFRTEAEAERYLNNLIRRSNAKEQLACTDEERKADEARSLVAQALLSVEKEERADKAAKALALSPKCAEAYIVFAELSEDIDKRVELLEKATGIACAQFDCERFEDPEGFFWQKISTRPYMRCRAALALALWQGDKKQSAIEHLKTLLKLNPYDNQGLRFHLLSWLLDYDAADVSIDDYFKEYEQERSAFGRYAYALWCYVRHGNEKKALKALDNAIEANKFVPVLLCGIVNTPDLAAKRVVRGSAQEAIAFNRIGGNAWKKTDGALAWLKGNCGSLMSSKTLIRKIETAEEWHPDGIWAGPMPMELSIARQAVWR
jgi:tetratricopeptide (TPR) repeat protein